MKKVTVTNVAIAGDSRTGAKEMLAAETQELIANCQLLIAHL
jgi:hypothetical protein